MEQQLVDLGWANFWSEDPPLVQNCKALKHHITTHEVRDYRRGVKESRLYCAICGYEYHYDQATEEVHS
jgi:hypothetical protein